MENQDFYQEALKAFDAPIPAPKKEEPAPETAAEVTEPAAPEKPKRKLNPWWAVALCAILCLALFIGLNRKPEKGSRGENCVYGYIITTMDQGLILNASDGRWYVELNGLEAPEYSTLGASYLWVFYDGEPEEIDNWNCTKKITASYLLRYADAGKTDRIEFDLDGDGQKEIWSFTYSVAMQPLLSSWQSPRLNLKAQDPQGNTLYAASMDVNPDQCAVFNDAGGKLTLVQYSYGIYHALDIRLEHGELAIYRGKESVTLDEPIVLPGDQPPITQPEQTTPSVPHQTTYTIQFELADRQVTGSIPTQMKNLTENEAVGLKNMLEALLWTDRIDEIYNTMCRFTLTVGNQAYTYTFSHDGLMRFGGKYTRIGTAMLKTLLELMPYEQPAEDTYFACLENGDRVRLQFEADGTASIITSDYASTNNQRFAGRYATFGSYYLLALGDDLRQILVLRRGDVSLHHVDVMSHQDMFQATKVVGFHPKNQAGTFLLSIRDADGKFSINKTPAILMNAETWYLYRFMDRCEWQPAEGVLDINEVLCMFDLFDGTGNDITDSVSYALLTGCRLYNMENGMVAAFEEESEWHFLTGYLCMQSQYCDETYFGTNQDGKTVELSLRHVGSYSMEIRDTDGAVLSDNGSYVYMGNSLVLLDWDDGPTYVHLDVQHDTLVYDAARSTPGEAFSQTGELTLVKLQADQYSLINLEFSIMDDKNGTIIPYGRSYEVLPEDLAKEISRVLNGVQWVKQDQGASGIWMGSFNFADSKDPWISVYSGMRLRRNGYEAQLTGQQWSAVCRVMAETSGIVYAQVEAIVGNVVYKLNTTSGSYHRFIIYAVWQDGHESLEGYYSLLEPDLLLCYGFNGEVFVLRMEAEGWRLLPEHNGIETFDIPDNTIFEEPALDVMPEVDVPA